MTRGARLTLFAGVLFLLVGPRPAESQVWVRDLENPVVRGDGERIHHVSDPVVVRDNGVYRMWFGFVGADASLASIGYAVSGDGSAWTLHPEAVLVPAAPGAWDDQTVEIPSVLVDRDETDPSKRYKMWYGGSSASAPNLTKIGYAYSSDGVSWTRLPADASPFGRAGLVLAPSNERPGDFAVVAEPTVLQRDGVFHMWYSSWDANALVISKASSPDAITWTKDEGNPVLRHSPSSWEAGGLGVDGTVAQPTVVWDGSHYLMWYGAFDERELLTYRGIGFAWSPDGVRWTKWPQPVLVADPMTPGERVGIGPGPTALVDSDGTHLWYGGVDASYSRVIQHAIWKPTVPPLLRSRR